MSPASRAAIIHAMPVNPQNRTRRVPGDEIGIASSGHSWRSADRRGEIVALVGRPGCEHYLVRWRDGRETVVAPSAVAVLSH
jgi:Domain of unknown function (DUF1918)